MLEDEFADIIKKARIGLNLALEDLAGASGLERESLRNLEAGRRTPSRPEVQAVASALHLNAGKLASIACENWRPAAIEPALLQEVLIIEGNIGGYGVQGYLFHDRETGEAVMIDTGYNPEAMLETIAKQALRLKAICLTHGHLDHAGGLDVILSRHPVPVYIGEDDWSLLQWKPPASFRQFVAHGDGIRLGKSELQFIRTPGHTPGGVCYQAGNVVFVGDTLFAGSIGRANPPALYPTHLESVRQQLLTLPEGFSLFPGHGPSTTVRQEQAHNPFA